MTDVFTVTKHSERAPLGAFSTLEVARSFVAIQLPIARPDLPQSLSAEMTEDHPHEVWNGYSIHRCRVLDTFSPSPTLMRQGVEASVAMLNREALQQLLEDSADA